MVKSKKIRFKRLHNKNTRKQIKLYNKNSKKFKQYGGGVLDRPKRIRKQTQFFSPDDNTINNQKELSKIIDSNKKQNIEKQKPSVKIQEPCKNSDIKNPSKPRNFQFMDIIGWKTLTEFKLNFQIEILKLPEKIQKTSIIDDDFLSKLEKEIQLNDEFKLEFINQEQGYHINKYGTLHKIYLFNAFNIIKQNSSYNEIVNEYIKKIDKIIIDVTKDIKYSTAKTYALKLIFDFIYEIFPEYCLYKMYLHLLILYEFYKDTSAIPISIKAQKRMKNIKDILLSNINEVNQPVAQESTHNEIFSISEQFLNELKNKTNKIKLEAITNIKSLTDKDINIEMMITSLKDIEDITKGIINMDIKATALNIPINTISRLEDANTDIDPDYCQIQYPSASSKQKSRSKSKSKSRSRSRSKSRSSDSSIIISRRDIR